MPERRWIEIIAIPLVISLVIAIFEFGLPTLLHYEKENEISYIIEYPIKYIDPLEIREIDIEVKVNGELVDSLYIYI